ncbi:MAG: VOC family protein [Anaerolineales bacterium]|uniref:VOC family protein n=1 Tax=Candidatus Villigracilis proximus TaxID=3140683 RepID=UPI003134BB0A|nr:VOC family protein [Anaerolineales bacterium]
MKKITPFLWFDSQAEEAMNFYVSLFKNSKVNSVSRGPDGKAFTVAFELDGQEFMGMNAGPQFKFNEVVLRLVNCEDQAEVDYFWNALTADGGEESMCSWCKDKYGLSWQIVPKQLGELMGDPDPEKSGRVMQAMLKMKKIIVADLKKAYNNE